MRRAYSSPIATRFNQSVQSSQWSLKFSKPPPPPSREQTCSVRSKESSSQILRRSRCVAKAPETKVAKVFEALVRKVQACKRNSVSSPTHRSTT